jgi:RNA polymerase sigma-70 factor (ECF subfamily)
MSHISQYVETDDAIAGAPGLQANLVARAQRGDRDAFAALIEPRASQLLQTARAILGNEADAYDAAQDALVSAWVRLPALRDLARFDAWLGRALVNKCRDVQRKRGRVREIDLTTTDATVGDGAAARAERAAILAAFDRLSADQRYILVLHYLHELQLTQIAVQLRVPVGTAKSRLWSARRALERALEAEA